MSDPQTSPRSYRVVIDPELLDSALAQYARIHEGGPVEVQVGIFRRFVANVLERSIFADGDLFWPENFWQSMLQLCEGRRNGLPEIILSQHGMQVYFWGHEIGELRVVSSSDDEPFGPSDAVEHRHMPPDDEDYADEGSTGC